jgi:hypothetical protein
MRFYREYLMQCGWGVMLGYDTVDAPNQKTAAQIRPRGAYASKDKGYCEKVIEIPQELLHLSDDELSKIDWSPPYEELL